MHRTLLLMPLLLLLSVGTFAKDYAKVTVFEYGTEGYNIFRIHAIIRAALPVGWTIGVGYLVSDDLIFDIDFNY